MMMTVIDDDECSHLDAYCIEIHGPRKNVCLKSQKSSLFCVQARGQVATVTVATARIAAAADIDQFPEPTPVFRQTESRSVQPFSQSSPRVRA